MRFIFRDLTLSRLTNVTGYALLHDSSKSLLHHTEALVTRTRLRWATTTTNSSY